MTKPTAPDLGYRLRRLDERDTAVRRVALISEIASLQSDLAQRRASLAADELALAKLFSELEAVEKQDHVKALALSPAKSLYLKTCEAASLLRCNEATAKKKGLKHGFAWKVDGRFRFSEPDLKAYLATAA